MKILFILYHTHAEKVKGATMFFKLILENANGDRVDMTDTANQYMTSQIEGLSPPPGTISTSSYAGMDGSYLNNAFIEKRNVVIHFEMRGVSIEARRRCKQLK